MPLPSTELSLMSMPPSTRRTCGWLPNMHFQMNSRCWDKILSDCVSCSPRRARSTRSTMASVKKSAFSRSFCTISLCARPAAGVSSLAGFPRFEASQTARRIGASLLLRHIVKPRVCMVL